MASRNNQQSEDELLSTPNSADQGLEHSAPPRHGSSNELSLLGEELLQSGGRSGNASGGDIGSFLADTADLLMPRAAPPAAPATKTATSSSSMSSKGRPPRARGPVQHQQQQVSFRGKPQPAHKNVQSSGDYSFISALTDSSSPADEGSPGRERSVSFEQSNVFGRLEMSESILQPILSEGDDMPLPQSITTPSRGNPKLPTEKILDTVTLSDIIGTSPLEAEAETAILRVLEEEEKDRSDPNEPPQILRHVSHEDSKAFTTKTTPEPAKERPSPKSTEVPVAIDSVQSSLRSSIERGPSKRPDPTSHSTRTATDKQEKKMRESKGLEHKLIGLTLAMNRLRAQSADHHAEIAAETQEQPLPVDELRTSDIFGGDSMVANANVLFRRKIGRQQGNLHLQPGLTIDEATSFGQKKTDSDVQGADVGVDVELGGTETRPSGSSAGDDGRKGRFGQRMASLFLKPVKRTVKHTEEDMKDFGTFLAKKKRGISSYLSIIIFLLIFPLLGVAALLFYALDNPTPKLQSGEGPSISWLLIFVARHLLLISLAIVSQLIVIDYLSLRRRVTVRLLGSWVSLGLVVSKGYPFLLVSWSFYSFCLLSGKHALARHWLYYQNAIDMWNDKNQSGTITSAHIYMSILGMAMAIGIVIALKRLFWGMYVGKKSYVHFGDQVAKTVEQMVLVSEVSQLSVLLTRSKSVIMAPSRSLDQGRPFSLEQYMDDVTDTRGSTRTLEQPRRYTSGSSLRVLPTTIPYSEHEKIIDESQKDKLTGRLTQAQKTRMVQLLEDWEEPECAHYQKKKVSINSILQFREALTFMDSEYVFSLSFGLANDRESCIESAQRVFERLLMATPGQRALPFETIAFLAVDEDDGTFDQVKMKSLIRLFRPDRDGTLTMLDFVRSCDRVYKDMRMLRASVKNTGQIDHSFELVVNWCFFVVLTIITVAVLGYDPLALFLSLSSIILAFAFMISSASSKAFEGILLILLRRPFDIGDRVHVSDVNSDTSAGGSASWFVQDVDLFTTTMRFATTNEVATVANGSLASSRIINCKRSPKAVRYVYMKFGVNVPYEKVQLFKRAVETFVKDRPREWLSLAGFRATRVEQDQGFIEYVIVLMHRESWQNIGPILNSTADVSSFCLELSKKLGMRYVAPPLPVNLSMAKSDNVAPTADATGEGSGQGNFDLGSPELQGLSPDVRALAKLFEKSATSDG